MAGRGISAQTRVHFGGVVGLAPSTRTFTSRPVNCRLRPWNATYDRPRGRQRDYLPRPRRHGDAGVSQRSSVAFVPRYARIAGYSLYPSRNRPNRPIGFTFAEIARVFSHFTWAGSWAGFGPFAIKAAHAAGPFGPIFHGVVPTWLNDQIPDAFVICASDDVGALSAAYLRAERFDGLFSVGLPNAAQRWTMWHIHIERYRLDPIEQLILLRSLRGTGRDGPAFCRLPGSCFGAYP